MTTTISSFQLIAIMICSRLTIILTSFFFFKAPYNITIFLYVLIGNGITYLLYFIIKRLKLSRLPCEYSFPLKFVFSLLSLFFIIILLFISFVNFREIKLNTNIIVSIVLFLVATIYCSTRGIETISRVSGIAVVIFIVMLIFIMASFIPNNIYYSFEKVSTAISPMFLLQNISILELFIYTMLKKNVKKNTKDRFWIYIVFSSIISCIILTFVYGVMGSIGSGYAFPLFTAASVSRSGFMRRLDVFLYCFYIIISLISCSGLLYIFLSFFKKGSGKH